VPQWRTSSLPLSIDEAEVIALKALAFLIAAPERADRFLRLAGLEPNDLRARTGDRQFLAGVVEHLLADESLLIVFSQDNDMDPRLPAMAAEALGRGPP
jgi:hypothetical protein